MLHIFHRLNFPKDHFALATPLLKNVSGLTLPRLNYELFNLANQKSPPSLVSPLWVFTKTLCFGQVGFAAWTTNSRASLPCIFVSLLLAPSF